MIKAQDAIHIARSLLGTPYAELDCINLIKAVIRTTPGGVKTYTTAGTNALWDSFDMSAKYRDLTWRQAGLSGAKAGMIAFKADGEDYHHAGIVTDDGTVIHSSSTQGGRGVVETPLTSREGWSHIAIHRYIETADAAEEEELMTLYRAVIVTEKDPLNVRESPKTGRILGKVQPGTVVDVVSENKDGWVRIRYNELVGYASAAYLIEADVQDGEAEELPEEQIVRPAVRFVVIDEAGNRFEPVGNIRVVLAGDD